MPASGLKTARIEHQYLAVMLANRSMGMAVDQAVGFREKVPCRVFDIRAHAGAVGKAEGEPVEGEQKLPGMAGMESAVAHVAVDGVDGFALEHLEYRRMGQVAGVDNDVTGMETLFDLLFETVVRSLEVRVRKYPCSDQHALPVWLELMIGGQSIKNVG